MDLAFWTAFAGGFVAGGAFVGLVIGSFRLTTAAHSVGQVANTIESAAEAVETEIKHLVEKSPSIALDDPTSGELKYPSV